MVELWPISEMTEPKNRKVNLPTTFGRCAHQSNSAATATKQNPALSKLMLPISKPESVNTTELIEMINGLENFLRFDLQIP